MPQAPKGQISDSYERILLKDFSGGLNTYFGAMNLPENASPDMLNVIPFPGYLKYRGGMNKYSSLASTADQAFFFYDTNEAAHFAIFENGNLVDVVGGSETVIASGVYTPGQLVGVTTLNGILYWATQTVALQYWDPAAATHGSVAQGGASPPPMSPFLFTYTGAIVALGVNFGGDWQPLVMSWSAINDPTTWNAANSQAVGPQVSNASLSFGIVLGIANTGVAPTRTFIVGRSDKGIISYTGALGQLQENAVNCPVGCPDGGSAVYCPGADGWGDVIFLGNDGQFWKTNGFNAVIASLNIQNLVKTQFSYAQAGSRFWASFCEQDQYYFCNVNDYQFVYKWDIQEWTVFTGWPNGPIVQAPDSTGVPSLFVASNQGTNKGFFQVGLPGIADNGVTASIYYRTAWLHANDPELLKVWQWLAINAYNTGTIYNATAQGMARSNDGSYMQSASLILYTQGTESSYFTLNQSVLDGPDVLAPGANPSPPPIAPPMTPVVAHGRLACPITWEEDSFCRGMAELEEGGGGLLYEDLKSPAIQITIAYNSGTIGFDLLGIQARFLERGYDREGGWQYDSEMGVANPNDPFVPDDIMPLDPNQPEPGAG